MSPGRQARLGACDLIELSQRATELSPGRWALALLRRAFPEATQEALMSMPVGARDRLVLAVRAELRPGPLQAEPVCRACGATYELTLGPEEIGLGGEAPWPEPGFRTVEISGRDIRLRPVAVSDLIEAEALADPEDAARLMATRVQEAALDVPTDDVPTDDVAAALEALDPGADVWLATACPECGTEQSMAFDAVRFLALELRHLSRQLMRDVADIARVFHWSEADILALPEPRRAFYLSEALA